MYQVGDVVYCLKWGYGVVKGIDSDPSYPVNIKFDVLDYTMGYTKHGEYLSEGYMAPGYSGWELSTPPTLNVVGSKKYHIDDTGKLICTEGGQSYETWAWNMKFGLELKEKIEELERVAERYYEQRL